VGAVGAGALTAVWHVAVEGERHGLLGCELGEGVVLTVVAAGAAAMTAIVRLACWRELF
jgi:hypothetical protein